MPLRYKVVLSGKSFVVYNFNPISLEDLDDAAMALAVMYTNGVGLPLDEARAAQWRKDRDAEDI